MVRVIREKSGKTNATLKPWTLPILLLCIVLFFFGIFLVELAPFGIAHGVLFGLLAIILSIFGIVYAMAFDISDESEQINVQQPK